MAQRVTLLKINKVYRTISGPAVLVIADVTPIEHKLRKVEYSQYWRGRERENATR